MKDIVIVQSKTINNESVPIVINIIDPLTGEKDPREITRSAIFINFQSKMSLIWAKYLINTYPNEYAIVDGVGELNKRTEQTVKTAQEKIKGFKCEYCGAEAKSKAGLVSHTRIIHPDKWVNKKTVETKLNKPVEETKEPAGTEFERPA